MIHATGQARPYNAEATLVVVLVCAVRLHITVGGTMRILILGGDGYLGWPQSLYLSSKGYDVTIFDNLARRHFDLERGFNSLIPIQTLHQRVAAWKEVSGRHIHRGIGDTMDYEALSAVFRNV
ncbi:MAG: hypothetical protein JO123_08945, partial [Ktedonobacteraceae bacterium]|nr:hypothetical protein [Ktedonobacteraceae bacterium]